MLEEKNRNFAEVIDSNKAGMTVQISNVEDWVIALSKMISDESSRKTFKIRHY
jgi:hypothetical protein